MGVTLRSCQLVDASVDRETPLMEAALLLGAEQLPAVAVLGAERKVVGVFSEDDVVSALFPRYLAELKHTAFLDEEIELAAQAERLSTTRVEERMGKDPQVLPIDTSVFHVAERFLHCEWGALPVVDESGRFVGMLRQAEFIRVVFDELASA